jgi:hypothetical protein
MNMMLKCQRLLIKPLCPASFTIFIALHYACHSQAINYKESSLDCGLQQVVVANDLMGGGVAVVDFNKDGWQDVFLIGGLVKSKLFKNLGNGVFTDVTEKAGGFARTGSIRTMGVVTGDLDNDGYPEILISTGRDLPTIVYHNNKDGTFTEITQDSGLRTTAYTIPILLGDYNLDGFLDVYMINYIEKPKSIFDSQGAVIGFEHTCYPNQLFVNDGGQHFTEVGELLEVNDKGCGLAGIFTDMDGDYLPDIYVANDFGEWTGWPNAFYKNQYPSNSFISMASVTGIDAAIYGMGIAHGDINNDGLLEIFTTNMGRNVLYKNKGDGTYEDITDAALVGNARTSAGLYNVGWGTAFTDPDNDSKEDLFVSYGYVPGSKIIETSWASEDKFYRNTGTLPFQDISAQIGLNDRDFSRGMAVADFDNDGDEDIIATKLIVTASGAKPNVLYYLNTTENNNNWLQVSLQGKLANRDALGSTIKVFSGELKKIETLSGGGSHASQHSNVVHIGLGQKQKIDSVEIFWPGGKRQLFKSVPVNTHIFIEEDRPGIEINGCTDATAANFNPQATRKYGCFYPKPGCTNPTVSQYDPEANVNDGSCGPSIVTQVPELAEKEIVNIYPNPFHDRINIDAVRYSRYRIELYTTAGQWVNALNFNEPENIWYPTLADGLYYYRIFSNNDIVSHGKLVKN